MPKNCNLGHYLCTHTKLLIRHNAYEKGKVQFDNHCGLLISVQTQYFESRAYQKERLYPVYAARNYYRDAMEFKHRIYSKSNHDSLSNSLKLAVLSSHSLESLT